MLDSMTPVPVGAPVPNPHARETPDHAALHGHSISLLPFHAERDAPALYRASHGNPEVEQVWAYLPMGPFVSAQALRDWYQAEAEPGDPLFYTVVDSTTAAPIGIVGFLSIAPEHGSIEIGHIWYAPERQRTNVNTEACALLLAEAFDRYGYRRVEWKCNALNARSRAAALRLGFQFEGIFRQHYIIRGRNRDTAWFSILDSEWSAIRAAIQRWLQWDDNFGPRPSLAALRATSSRPSGTATQAGLPH